MNQTSQTQTNTQNNGAEFLPLALVQDRPTWAGVAAPAAPLMMNQNQMKNQMMNPQNLTTNYLVATPQQMAFFQQHPAMVYPQQQTNRRYNHSRFQRPNGDKSRNQQTNRRYNH